MVLAHKIRLKRKEKGYSQDYMADQLGITSSTYSKIERGETRLDVDRLKQIVEVLEVDILDLLSEDSIIVAYNGDCSVNGYNAIESYRNDDQAKVWERMVNHMREEITTLRQEMIGCWPW